MIFFIIVVGDIKMDYKKRELNKLVKAYDLIYDVDNGYYRRELNIDSDTLCKVTELLETLIKLNGYNIEVGSNDKFKLVKAK